jgi:hypothetical protein
MPIMQINGLQENLKDLVDGMGEVMSPRIDWAYNDSGWKV